MFCFLSMDVNFWFFQLNYTLENRCEEIFFSVCKNLLRALCLRKSTDKTRACTKSLDKYTTVCFPNYCCSWKWKPEIERCTIYIVTLVLSVCYHPVLNGKRGCARNRKTNDVSKHRNIFNNKCLRPPNSYLIYFLFLGLWKSKL